MQIDMEERFCERVKQMGCTCVTISHRPALVAFHDLVLALDGEGGWAVHRGAGSGHAGEDDSLAGKLLGFFRICTRLNEGRAVCRCHQEFPCLRTKQQHQVKCLMLSMTTRLPCIGASMHCVSSSKLLCMPISTCKHQEEKLKIYEQ